MKIKNDISGLKINKLTVIKMSGLNRYKARMCICKCDCGIVTEKIAYYVRKGIIMSCGCYKKSLKMPDTTNHGMYKSRIHGIWTSMKGRCLNSKNKKYKYYGGRGIKISEKWNKFEGFFEDMNSTYKDTLTIDRIDNDGDYCKENCRWATAKEQQNNRGNNRLITYNGQTKTLSQWAEMNSLTYDQLRDRLRNGWKLEKALKTEIKYQKRKNLSDNNLLQ